MKYVFLQIFNFDQICENNLAQTSHALVERRLSGEVQHSTRLSAKFWKDEGCSSSKSIDISMSSHW